MDAVKNRRMRIKMAMALCDIDSQKELATLADIAPKTLIHLLQGKVSPDSETISRIAGVLKQRRSWIEGEGDIREFALPKEILEVIVNRNAKLTAMRLRSDVTSELPPGYGPIVKNPKMQNRRHELRVVHVTLKSSRGESLPTWVNLAAGPGRELEISLDFIHVREMPDWKNHHSLIVSGDSMRETLEPGDIVILRRLENCQMVALSSNANIQDDFRIKPMSHWKKIIPHDSIVVLSLNGEEPTLKRIKYMGTDAQWFMSVNADNPNDWPESPRTIIPTDEVVFHGILYSIGDGKYDRAKRNISYWKDLKK